MYIKRQETWVNYPSTPSLIDADVANWWEAGIYGAHQGLAALAVRAVDYGVVGDGVADDSTAFAAALAAASSGSRTLNIGGATVKLAAGVTIPAGVVVTGGGRGGTILAGSAVSTFVTMGAGARLEDVTVDAAGLVSSYAVYVNSVDGVVLRRATIKNAAIGVEVRGTSARTRIEDCDITACTTGIRVREFADYTVIDRCRFTSWIERAIYLYGVAGDGGATPASAPSNVRISRNFIGPHSPGGAVRQPIQCTATDSYLFANVTITDNDVKCLGTSDANPTTPGSADGISLHRARGFVISGNRVSGSGDVGITVARQCIGGTVSDNVIDSPDSVGMCIGSADSTYVKGITVRGNVVFNANQNRQNDGVTRAKSGILLVEAIGCLVDGNVVIDDQAAPTTNYGLTWRNVTDLTVGDNRYIGMTVADTYREGTNSGVRWSSAPRRVVKTADTTRNNTATVADDPHLAGLTLSPGGVYRLSSRLIYNATTTADINVKWSVPSGTTMDWSTDSPVPTTTTPNGSIQATSQTVGSTATIGGTGVSTVGHPEGIITVGSTPGTLTMQWAQGTAEASNATLSAGSWVEIVRVA